VFQDRFLEAFSVDAQPVAPKVAVVIPCFRVAAQVADVIARVGPECTAIYVIDDACPERSGEVVRSTVADPRVRVIRHDVNQGVGGAMITGYRTALAEGADIVVKIDGDGQMDPTLIPKFVAPIASGRADYVKGNRFYNLEDVQAMPASRLVGNLALSFLTKLSSGYWGLFDPNNGFVAIDARVLANMPLQKISRRYFFESDMLFRLNIMRAVVFDMPMRAVYEQETSSLIPHRVAPHFLRRHLANVFKRVFYSYFLRDFSMASVELVLGCLLFLFGLTFGSMIWIANGNAGVVSTTGTVMIAVLPLLIGLQLLLAFIGCDIGNAPSQVVGPLIEPPDRIDSTNGPSRRGAAISPVASVG
jgi:glycosyltransferase involved in cell wall biosynthesis